MRAKVMGMFRMRLAIAIARRTKSMLILMLGMMMLASAFAVPSASAQQSVLPDSAVIAFHDATLRAGRALARDAGRLWGARLDTVPWLGVSGRTMLLTADPDTDGYTRTHDIWEGPLPATITPSNTSVAWARRRWAMVLLPVYGDTLGAERLLIHEAMHVLQPSLLPAPSFDETGAGAALLDEASGRTWLRLELKALATALRSSGASRDSAAYDALLFRSARYMIASPDEVTRERALDVKEGIPEYTGWKLSGSPRSEFLASVDSAPANFPSLVRSFEYFTGPAYAMLLDDYTDGRWRASLVARVDLQSMLVDAITAHEFAEESLLKRALAATAAPRASRPLARLAHSRAEIYGAPAILAEENLRWATRQRQLAEYRAKFVEGRVIMLRPGSLNISFDPRGQASLGVSGTVMANLAWKSADGSSLTAPGGALVNQSWTELRVPLGDSRLAVGRVMSATTIHGDGWTLVLEPGWNVSASGASIVVSPPPK